MNATTTLTLGLLCLCLPLGAHAQAHHDHRDGHASATEARSTDRDQKWREALARPSLAVTATFDEHGRLWIASIRDRHVEVSHSGDRGATFSPPVKVNAEPEYILGDGENRPKIVVRRGVVYVAYTRGLSKPMTGDIRFARSIDGGRTFTPPVTVNDNHDVISHRFEALSVADDGTVHLAWLDKRDLHAAQARGEPYRGAALYYAVARDGGARFAPNQKLADHTCECCRVAMALDGDGVPVIAWRHIFEPNTRDHAVLRLDGRSALARLSHEQWAIDACPHHGPAIAIGSDGVYHFAWFSGASASPGLFYARSADRGRSFSSPLRFGDADAQPGHAQVLSHAGQVYLAWKEFDGTSAHVRGMVSRDGGRTWSATETLASTAGTSDHPLLVSDGGQAYLSWNTRKEGYRLIPISRPHR